MLTLPGLNQPPPPPYQYVLVGILISLPAFLFFRLSDHMSRYFSIHDLFPLLGATLTVVAASDLTLFVSNRLEGVPRSTPLIYGLVLFGGLVGGRALARLSRGEVPPTTDMPKQPHLRRVILIGVDRFASLVIKLTDCQQPRTTQVVAALDARERLHGRTINGAKIVGGPGDIEAVIEEYFVHGVEIDEIWITNHAVTSETREVIEHLCLARGVRTSNVADALNLGLAGSENESFSAEDTRVAQTPRAAYFRFKRALDFLVALALLILLTPVAAIIATITYLDVGSPVMFWQRRIGRRGVEFFLYKFRTYQAPYKRNGDPVPSEARLSKTGNLIRALRFDEIPQLLNMLSGDMSLIGPRPLLPVDQPEDPTQRLQVRPGVTGWAQVVGGTSVNAEEKEALDVWYIHHASPMVDLKIIWRTLRVLFRGESRCQKEIDEALRWRESLRRIDRQLFKADRKAPHAGTDKLQEDAFRNLAAT